MWNGPSDPIRPMSGGCRLLWSEVVRVSAGMVSVTWYRTYIPPDLHQYRTALYINQIKIEYSTRESVLHAWTWYNFWQSWLGSATLNWSTLGQTQNLWDITLKTTHDRGQEHNPRRVDIEPESTKLWSDSSAMAIQVIFPIRKSRSTPKPTIIPISFKKRKGKSCDVLQSLSWQLC